MRLSVSQALLCFACNSADVDADLEKPGFYLSLAISQIENAVNLTTRPRLFLSLFPFRYWGKELDWKSCNRESSSCEKVANASQDSNPWPFPPRPLSRCVLLLSLLNGYLCLISNIKTYPIKLLFKAHCDVVLRCELYNQIKTSMTPLSWITWFLWPSISIYYNLFCLRCKRQAREDQWNKSFRTLGLGSLTWKKTPYKWKLLIE